MATKCSRIHLEAHLEAIIVNRGNVRETLNTSGDFHMHLLLEIFLLFLIFLLDLRMCLRRFERPEITIQLHQFLHRWLSQLLPRHLCLWRRTYYGTCLLLSEGLLQRLARLFSDYISTFSNIASSRPPIIPSSLQASPWLFG